MDAAVVALPGWLEAVLARIACEPRVAVVGTGMVDLLPGGEPGTVHRMPAGTGAVRCAALFSSPFFPSTVAVDGSVLEQHGLRYDTSFEESEDYDLWTRLLEVADGDNVRDAVVSDREDHADGDNVRDARVLYREHDAQSSARRAELQLEGRRLVALRQIEELAPARAG